MVRISAYAKLNLALAVLGKRSNGYHEIRSVFQTISLADRLTISFARGRRTSIAVTASVEIPGENICTKTARAALEAMRVSGAVSIHIDKRIPMGGGLGGGSTDAAAVLLALPGLAGKRVERGKLLELAAGIGSDVPFFLEGGCALVAGRGEQLYPLPDPVPAEGVLIDPKLHVSTPEAYRALARGAATDATAENFPLLDNVSRMSWAIAARRPVAEWGRECANDFESAVFARHPQLEQHRRALARLGAVAARMTGSGAALYGLFPTREAADRAAERWPGKDGSAAHRFRLISRARYRAAVSICYASGTAR